MEQLFLNNCFMGKIEFAKKILHKNPHINIQMNNNYAFKSACENGHLNICKWLLQIGVQISNFEFEHAFRHACYKGYLEIAKWLLEIQPQINISAQDEFAFRAACYNNHLEMAKWFQTLKPYLYVINYNADDDYVGHYVRAKEEARWQQTKYLVWLSSPQSPNTKCVFYNLPFDISRYIIQNFI